MTFMLSRAPYQINVSGIASQPLAPSSTYPVTVYRDDLGIVQIRTASVVGGAAGDYDLTLLRDPAGYSSVSKGMMRVGRSMVAGGKRKIWSQQPMAMGSIDNADFAMRMGRYDQAYPGAADWADFQGFGHGFMTWRDTANASAVLAGSGSAMQMDGAGTNLFNTGAFPNGTLIRGSQFTIFQNFDIVNRSTSTVQVALQTQMIFDANGLTFNGWFVNTGANVGHQDWYSAMYPANGDVGAIKPFGLTAVTVTRPTPDVGRPAYPAWSSSDSFNAGGISLYDPADPTMMDTLDWSGFGAGIRKTDFSDAAWALNGFQRAKINDTAQSSKFYLYAASRVEASPAAIALTSAYRWQTKLRGKVGTPA